MNDKIARITETVEKLRREFAGDPNIHSIGFGLPQRGGKHHDELSIIFFVKRKFRSEKELAASGSRPIPETIDGFPTDVQDIRLRSHSSATGDRDSKIRNPLVQGVATSNADNHVWLFNWYGTLGTICRDSGGNAMALSNWHVWASGGNIGDTIIQPGHPRTEDHLEGLGKVAACGPLVTSIIEGEPISPLTAGLYGGAAAAAIAAAASDIKDPTRRGQEATVTDPMERTQYEQVKMQIGYPDLPWPGLPFRVGVDWKYERHTDARVLPFEVKENKINTQFLLGRFLTIDKAEYRPGETIRLRAAIWDYQPRPCDGYHVTAHLIPAIDRSRVIRVCLHPAPCPENLPQQPPPQPGPRLCIDFESLTLPDQQWGSHATFQWLGVVAGAGAGLRAVDFYPSQGNGRGELYIPRQRLFLQHQPASEVEATIVSHKAPVTLLAFDGFGQLVGRATSKPGADPFNLHIKANMIVSTELRDAEGQSSLLRYCILPVGSEKPKINIDNSVLTALEREQPASLGKAAVGVHRCCFAGETTVPPAEKPGAWDAFLVVQNVNQVAEGTDPAIAAQVIGGHVLTPSAQVSACEVTMLADHVFHII